MSYKTATVGFAIPLAFVGFAATATPSYALSGIGCPDLPLYYRAIGKLQNPSGAACDISLEEARAVLAHENGPTDAVLVPGPYGHRIYRRR